MDELIAFVRAALDEDERVAREAPGPAWCRAIERDGEPGRWRGIKAELVTLPDPHPGDSLSVGAVGATVARCDGRREAEHIARWDPARVLAEVEAKRRVLDRYEDARARQQDPDYSQLAADEQVSEYEDWIIPALAQPYAGRPGWQEEWRA